MPDIYASFDKPVVEKDRPIWSDAYEVGRQIGAGVAVDLPRMVGQGVRRVSRDGGMVDELARGVVESADERAAGWEPDMRGRGLVAETLIKGGRAVGPMAPAIAASLNPFGMYTGPAVAGALFGTSAAQNTEDKLRLQGVPDDRATEAGIYTGLVQGPSEAVGTALGLRFMKAAAPLNPFAKPPGMGGFVERATDTAVLKPFAQNFGLNLLGQPATEVAQDGTTELIERGYGAAPEDLWDIAKNSAQSAVGLTALLGPFGAASQVGVSRRNEALRGALQSEDPTTRLAAIDALTTQAKKQGVAPAEIEAWRVEQLQPPPAPSTRGASTSLLDGADSNDLVGGEYSPLSNPLMYGQTADGRSVTSTLTPETTDPRELVARHADIGRYLGSIEKKLQELQSPYEAAVASGDRAAQARIQNLRSELQKSGFAANDEYNQLDPSVQRYLAENYESGDLFGPQYASTSGRPSNLINGGISFADAESINVPTQFRPEFVDQSLGLRFPQPGAAKSRMSDVEAALSEPTNMYAVSQPDQYEQRLDAGQVAALQAGQLEDDANKQAEAKYAAKRTAATDTLIEREPDGTLPLKLKPREIETYSTLAALREAGTITPEVYRALVGKMKDALKNNSDGPTLTAVAKEVKKLATPAPAAAPAAPPTAPVTPAPAAPAAPTEPVNQLLQGQPDVSNAAMVGGGTEQRGAGGGAVAGTSVAPTGRAAGAAVGNAPAASGVAAVGGQAGAVSDAKPGVAPTVGETIKKTGKLLDKIKGKTAVIGGSVDFSALKDALEALSPQMHHAIRLTLGVDKDGYRLDRPMSAQAAAEKAGISAPGKTNTEVSRISNALGITKDVRNRFTSGDALATERAEGNIEGTVTDISESNDTTEQAEGSTEDNDTGAVSTAEDATPVTSDEAFDEGGDGELTFADTGSGVISDIGGSQSRIESAPKGSLQNQSWYKTAVAGGLVRLGDSGLSAVVAKAVPYANDPSSKSAVAALMDEVRSRMGKTGFSQVMTLAYNKEYPDATNTKKSDAEYAADERSRTEDTSRSDGSDTAVGEYGGQDGRSGSEASDDGSAGRVDSKGKTTPVVTVKKSRKAVVAKLQDTSNVLDGTDLVREVNGKIDDNLSSADQRALALHYSGETSFTPSVRSEFLEDVLTAINKGLGAVDEAVRKIVSKVMAAVLTVAMVFNPYNATPAQAVVVSSKSYFVEKGIKLPDVPVEAAARMSPAAQTAYQQLFAGLKAELQKNDKLLIITDKPSARVFVFNPDGTLLLQDKVLIGKQAGDKLKGDNDIPTNRITPAGLFNMGLRDAARGGSEARTAGDYDFGKVFVLDKAIEGEYSVTLLHSVWTREADAKQRLNALNNDKAEDSRYSFGCINLRKSTYKTLLDKHLPQMDGAKLFVVPDNQAAVQDFLSGEMANNTAAQGDGLTRQSVPEAKATPDRVVETSGATSQQDGADQSGNSLSYIERRRQQNRNGRTALKTRSNKFTSFEDLQNDNEDVGSAKEQLASLGIENSLDFVSDWETYDNPAKDAEGGSISARGGRYVVRINEAKLTDPQEAAETVTHEIGHAVDMAPHGGVYSSQREMRFAVVDGRITPIGEVAKEIHDLYENGSSGWKDYLAYPFDTAKFPDLDNHVSIEGEAFAQIFSLYLNPRGREAIEKRAPLTAAYMKEVVNDIRSTKALQIQTARTVAKRTVAFANRDATGSDSRLNQVQAVAGGRGGRRGPESYASRSSTQAGITSSSAAPANAQTQPVATAEKAIRAYPPALRPAARAVHRALGKYARGALNTVMFTEDLMNRAIDLGMKSAKAYKDLANQKESFTGNYERKVLNAVSGYGDLPEKIKGKGPGTVNAFLQDSQMQSDFAGKWGYQPSWLDKVEIDPKAQAAYDALGKEGMAYVDSVFKLGHDTLALKKQTVIESTTSEYDVLIAAAKKDGNTAEAAELTAEKTKTLEQFGTMMKLGGKFPYSPVKRFGNYVVVAESQKYIDARKAGDTKLMRQLEGDSNEYFVDFAESDGAAQAIEDELRATGLYVDPGYRPREAMRDDLYGGSNTLKALSKLRERAAAMPEATSQDKQTKEAATKLRTLLTDLYLMQLAEGSSRKSEMKRRGVAGNIDMIRSLETQGKADANFLGSVKFGGKMLESIGDMRKEMREGTSDQRLRRAEVLNEVVARHLQSMDYKETPLVDKLRSIPSVMFLALSPSYYIQNSLQPFMLSLPLMAARHGYGKTSKALVDAYASVAPAFKNADVWKQIDFDALLDPSNKALTKDEKAMVQTLLDSGRLDIGMTSELGSLRVEGDGKAKAAWNKAHQGLQEVQAKMEALNRLSTALAAFRLGSGNPKVTSTQYADRIIQESHGNYNAQNAPRAFNTAWGKIGLQFRKYQLIQLTLMAKLLQNSFANATTQEEKDARHITRKALAYTMGQAAVIGGGKALPIPFAVAWLFGAAFGDDSDEPPEYVLRQMIGNKDIADLLISGPLSFVGINGAGLGGFGNAVAALPFVDVDLTSREGVMETAFAIGAGPLGGLALKTADGIGAMANGDYFKGLGMLLPKGPGSFIKAGEQKINGIYQRDGDTTMSADEISEWATFQQALGFTPQQTLERQYRQQAAYKIDGSMKDQNSEIKRMYSRALKDGESTAEAKEAWLKYQAKRVNMGYKRQPMSELTKSAQTQREREKETVGGVQYKKNNEQFVRDLNAY